MERHEDDEIFGKVLDDEFPPGDNDTSGDQKEKQTEREKALTLKVFEKIEGDQFLFFHDQYKNGFCSFTGDGRGVLKIRSRIFRLWMSNYIWNQLGTMPKTEMINNITQALEGKALFEGKQYPLEVRIRKDGGVIWHDLGEQAVRIDKDGWTVIDNPPILFRRLQHQTEQIIPLRGGDLKELCNFVNVKSEDDKLLFLVFTAAAFISDFPHPLLVFFGPQGSGKTTPQRLLKSLIDPSILKTLSVPDGLREFVQVASHHYFLFLDNLSSLPSWLSNALSRACTGDGFSKRELYSDDDDVIYSFQRTIALNGINLVVQKSDLLERSILIGLERISREERREEEEFWQDFENRKPYLLGAIFDAVAGALREYSKIKLSSHPRMADFTRWGCAIAKTLGYTQEEFLTAYDNNINRQNEEALEASPVATTLIAFIEDSYESSWEGTPTELHETLKKKAEELSIDTKSREWPKAASSLWKRVQLVQTNLIEVGIKIARDEKARPRRIIIQKIRETTDGGDGLSENGAPETTEIEAGPTVKTSPLSPTDRNTGGELEAKVEPSTTPTVSTAETPCPICNSRMFWKASWGGVLCALCHPPPSEEQVARWIGEE